MKTRDLVRLLIALIFLLSAIANTCIVLFTPTVYETFATDSFLPLYRDLWQKLVYPQIHLFLIPAVLVEVSLAWLLLRSETYVRLGLMVALAFTLVLIPFWWQGGAIANLVLATSLIWLLSYDYPTSVSEILMGY